MSVTTTIAFDRLLAQAQERQRAAELAEQEQARQERRRNIERFRASFPLSPEEQAILGVQFHAFSNSARCYASIAGIWADDYAIITSDGIQRHDCYDTWSAEAYRGEGKKRRSLVRDVAPEELCARLVLAIAAYRQDQEAELAALAERERVQAARQAAWERQAAEEQERRAQREAEASALREAALATHRELVVEVMRHLSAAQDALWRWPAGASVTLYRWRWQVAGAVDEDGELVAEHEEGWSSQATPDAGGFVRFETSLGRSRLTTLRAAQFVTVEQHVVTSLAELPSDLITVERLSIPGLRYANWGDIETGHGDRIDVATEEGDTVLIRDDDGELGMAVGQVPFAWVRRLVEVALQDD